MKKVAVILILILAAFLFVVVFRKTGNQIKRTETFDTFGQVFVTLDKTLGTNSLALTNYNAATETKEMFPFVPTANGQLLDAWQKPIEIKLTRIENGFQVSLTSFGPDGVSGTKDDLIQNRTILDQSIIAK